MEDLILLLVLLLTQAIETSSQPYVPDANRTCAGHLKYIREESGLCCSRCPPGYKLKTACTETDDTVCEPCGRGLYMENWNFATKCLSCSSCKESKGLQFTQRCSTTTRAKCGCMPGRFCYMTNIKGCQECLSHTTCKEGSGVSVPGTNTSDVRCQNCPEGTFSDTVSPIDTCKPHTSCDERDIIRKGNATSDTVCRFVASTQTKAARHTKPETTVISTAATHLRKATTFQSMALPRPTTNSTIPGIVLLSITEKRDPTKKQVPDTGPDKQLAAVIGGVAGIFLLIVVIVLLVLCKRRSSKKVDLDHTKVDANGNCETDSSNTNLFYVGDTHHSSIINVQPEQQCLLQNGTLHQNHCTSHTDEHNSHESTDPQQSTLPLHQPESAWSEPLPLQSNMDQFVSSKNGPTVQTSSQPTSPQSVTSSPLVNVNINLHIGNGTCGAQAVMLKDLTPAEPQIPFGEEEESRSFLQQEDGKPSLLSVEESESVNDILLKTMDQFV